MYNNDDKNGNKYGEYVLEIEIIVIGGEGLRWYH